MLNKQRFKDLLRQQPLPANIDRVRHVSSYDLAAGYASTVLLGAVPYVIFADAVRSELLTALLIGAAVPALSIALLPTLARKVGPDRYALPSLGELLAVMCMFAFAVVALGAALGAVLDARTDWLGYSIALALTAVTAAPVSFRQSQSVNALRTGG